jgi:hypothetical protein
MEAFKEKHKHFGLCAECVCYSSSTTDHNNSAHYEQAYAVLLCLTTRWKPLANLVRRLPGLHPYRPNYEGRLQVRGLILLLRVWTLWRCGDGLFFEVPPLASDALLTTLHPLLKNVLQTVDHFEISCLGAHFSWLKKPRNRMGRDLDCMADILMGFHRSIFSKPNKEFNPDLAPCDFWAFRTMKRELRGKKFRSDQRSAARFREVGGAL